MSLTPNRAVGKSRKVFIAAGVCVFALLIAVGVFARNGWFPQTDALTSERTGWFGRKSETGAIATGWFSSANPTPTPQLSKEYIYAGSRLLAVEDANANAVPPADLAVWRPSDGTFYVMGGPGSQQTSQGWGMAGDIPVQGDYDGDGKTDFCVFRPSDNNWYIINSSDGSITTISFAAAGDIPAPADYDGDGSGARVKKVTNTETTVFVYDAFGKLVAEYSTQVSPEPRTSYLTTDDLGSPRVITDEFGQVVARHDYMHFGEEVLAGVGGRTSAQGYGGEDEGRQKFTGYERDDESGLDYAQARYFKSTHGRFTSPDEFKGGPDELFDFEEDASDNPTFYADLTNPQSLNKYQYGYNNPYKYNDPSGHCPKCIVVWAYAEIAGTVADVVDAVNTIRNPNASTNQKIAAVSGTLIGVTLPGAGYGKASKTVVQIVEKRFASGAAKTATPAAATTPAKAASSSPKPVTGSSGGPGSGKRTTPRQRRDIQNRDKNKCVYCQTPTTRERGGRQSNVDHSDPRSRGGDTTDRNLQNTCRTCNQRKRARTDREFRTQDSNWIRQRRQDIKKNE